MKLLPRDVWFKFTLFCPIGCWMIHYVFWAIQFRGMLSVRCWNEDLICVMISFHDYPLELNDLLVERLTLESIIRLSAPLIFGGLLEEGYS